MATRRDDILDVAKEIFAERGVKATTVRQIGARAGMVSGSLYHHFGSKLDMVDAILHELCDEILARYEEIAASTDDAVERLRRFARYAFSLVADQRAALVVFYNEARYLVKDARFSYLNGFDRRIEDYWSDAIDAGVAQGRIRADIDTRLFYRVIRDTIAGAVDWYGPKDRPIEEVADTFIGILLYGILVHDGDRAVPKS